MRKQDKKINIELGPRFQNSNREPILHYCSNKQMQWKIYRNPT